MPARSNIFQRLVAEIHRDLGPGWNVAESRELEDVITGELREVDVVAEATVGSYPLLICIEVRDRKRPADVPWLEGIAKKHEHLLTSKLALWSSSGFTAPALLKAKKLGIDVVTPGSTEEAPWAKIAQDAVGSTIKYLNNNYTLFLDVKIPDGAVERWPLDSGTTFLHNEGEPLLPLEWITDQIRSNPEVRSVLLDHAQVGPGNFHATYTHPHPCHVISPSGVRGEMIRVMIDMVTTCEVASVSAMSALHAGTLTTLEEAQLSDGVLRLVLRETRDGPPSFESEHSNPRPSPKPITIIYDKLQRNAPTQPHDIQE